MKDGTYQYYDGNMVYKNDKSLNYLSFEEGLVNKFSELSEESNLDLGSFGLSYSTGIDGQFYNTSGYDSYGISFNFPASFGVNH